MLKRAFILFVFFVIVCVAAFFWVLNSSFATERPLFRDLGEHNGEILAGLGELDAGQQNGICLAGKLEPVLARFYLEIAVRFRAQDDRVLVEKQAGHERAPTVS